MADSGAIRAGKAVVEATLDDAALKAGLDRALAKLKDFGAGFALGFAAMAAGVTAGVAAIGAAAYTTAGYVTHMLHEAEQVGASIGFISALGTTMELAGGSAEGATQAIFRMNSTLTQAINGSMQAQRAFTMLGISAESLNDLTTDERMDRISDAIGKLSSHAERSRVAMLLFGRGGRQMLDDLSRPGGLRAAREELEKLGLVLTNEQAEKWRDLNRSWVLLKASASSLSLAVLEPMIPLFRGIATGLGDAARAVRDWARENLTWLEAVGNAMEAGNLSLAWDTLMAALKVGWLEFTQFVMDSIPVISEAFKSAFERAFEPLGEARQQIEDIIGRLQQAARLGSVLSQLSTFNGNPLTLAARGVGSAAGFGPTASGAIASGGSATGVNQAQIDLERAQARLRELTEQAQQIRRRPPSVNGPTPDHIEATGNLAARGTFNADVAFGLAAANNPVVDAINRASDREVAALESFAGGMTVQLAWD